MSGPIEIRFTVPGKPQPQERARSRVVATKGGKLIATHYTPSKTRAEQAAIRLFAATAMQGRPPLEGPLELHMTAYVPVPASWSNKKQAAAIAGMVLPVSRPDCDNYGKLCCDSLNGTIWRDDAQIVRLVVEKLYSVAPRIEVLVRTYEAEDAGESPGIVIPPKATPPPLAI